MTSRTRGVAGPLVLVDVADDGLAHGRGRRRASSRLVEHAERDAAAAGDAAGVGLEAAGEQPEQGRLAVAVAADDADAVALVEADGDVVEDDAGRVLEVERFSAEEMCHRDRVYRGSPLPDSTVPWSRGAPRSGDRRSVRRVASRSRRRAPAAPRRAVCTRPSESVARTGQHVVAGAWRPTRDPLDPGVGGDRLGDARRAATPRPSTWTSTFEMPVCGAQATPATATVPAETAWPCRGDVDARLDLDRARARPAARRSSRRRRRAKVVTLSSVTHLVAET